MFLEILTNLSILDTAGFRFVGFLFYLFLFCQLFSSVFSYHLLQHLSGFGVSALVSRAYDFMRRTVDIYFIFCFFSRIFVSPDKIN